MYSDYLPLHSQKNVKSWLRVPFSTFAVCTVSLPLFSFLFCLIWSLYYFFEKSTSTHCNVYNFLPSLSATIGSYQPQIFVWNTAITVHLPPRFITLSLYQQYYSDNFSSKLAVFKYLLSALNFIEVCSLGMLSFWSSTANYTIHKISFITFLITSVLYMILTCIIFRFGFIRSLTQTERKSLRTKWKCLIVNVLGILASGYFFIRHNEYCEPLVYSLFALSEYVVVVSNMAFHMTASFDFNSVTLCFNKNGQCSLM